jgi:hypothetical protein
MRKSLAGLALMTALLGGDRALAQDHVVTPQAAWERLTEAEAARQRDLARIDGLLSSPEAAAAARAVGADMGAVRRAALLLSDEDLRDLVARAAALSADPAAGISDNDVRWMLYIFLIVAIVILVLQAVD